MVGSLEKAAGLRKRLAWRPLPILDGGQDYAIEGATEGQQILSRNEKVQKEEKQWTFYLNQGTGSCISISHTAKLTEQPR